MLHVAAAILYREGNVLICRRGPGGSCGGLWEFPGGKLEPGETPTACAVRECREELGVEIDLGPLYESTTYRYPDKEIAFSFFTGTIRRGDPCMRVHTALCWCPPQELADYTFCPADRDLVQDLARRPSREGRGPMASGNTAEIYQWGRGRILKLYRPGMGRASCAQEFAAALVAQDLLPCVPAVYGQIEVEGRPGIVYQRVEGPSMLEKWLQHPQQALRGMGELAALHWQVHQAVPQGLPTVHLQLAESIRRVQALTEEEKAALLDRLEGLPGGSALCHFDFHPGNVLLADRGPVVIDWMTACVGDAAADAARTELILGYARTPEWMEQRGAQPAGFPREAAPLYRREYCRLSGLAPWQIDRWLAPVAAARLNEWLPAPEKEALLRLVRASLQGPRQP